MVKLSEARKVVADIIGEENTPAHTTLRGWANRGIISKKVGGNTKQALYPEIVLLEILTVIDLKDKYTLSEIANFRKDLNIENMKSGIKAHDIIEKLSNYTDIITEKQDKLVARLNDNSDVDTEKRLSDIEKGLKEINEIKKKSDILKDYFNSFEKSTQLVSKGVIQQKNNSFNNSFDKDKTKWYNNNVGKSK